MNALDALVYLTQATIMACVWAAIGIAGRATYQRLNRRR